MKLTEANDLSFNQRFKEAQTAVDKVNVLTEFGKLNNLGGADWDEFVNTNYVPLVRECEAYGLSLDNPFFVFLKKYGNIKVFLNSENYDILHNIVASNIISTKQLAFTCPESDQVRLLLNPNLWNIAAKDDVKWLIKTFVWFLEENTLNDYVINVYVRAAFSENSAGTGEQQISVNFDTFANRKKLLRNLYFTTNINQVNDAKLKSGNDDKEKFEQLKTQLNAASDDYFVSRPLQPVDIIEQQIKVLNQNVQESARGERGQYQQKESDEIDPQPQFSKEDTQIIKTRANAIIDAAGKELQSTDRGAIKRALAYIGSQL